MKFSISKCSLFWNFHLELWFDLFGLVKPLSQFFKASFGGLHEQNFGGTLRHSCFYFYNFLGTLLLELILYLLQTHEHLDPGNLGHFHKPRLKDVFWISMSLLRPGGQGQVVTCSILSAGNPQPGPDVQGLTCTSPIPGGLWSSMASLAL